MVELTEKDFQIFKEEAQFWIDKFGLLDWSVTYSFEKLECSFYAECQTNWLGKCATLALNKWVPKSCADNDIKRTAFHEVCELLLTEMELTALDEQIPYEERKGLTAAARHGVIRRLENSVFKMRYAKEKNNANCTVVYD